jgi:hypothetical protein
MDWTLIAHGSYVPNQDVSAVNMLDEIEISANDIIFGRVVGHQDDGFLHLGSHEHLANRLVLVIQDRPPLFDIYTGIQLL